MGIYRTKSSVLWLILVLVFLSLTARAQYDRSESSGDFPLPVTLMNFTAAGGDNSVVLCWKTCSEIDLAGFNLYRALGCDGVFSPINPVLVPARGTGPDFQEYQYIDQNLSNGFHYYYKLSTVDLNGREAIEEPPILGIPGNPQETSWQDPALDLTQFALLRFKGNYPEPFNGQAWIAFSVYESSRVLLQIYDISGRKVASLLDCIFSPGDYVQLFNGDHLPSGVYFCRLQGENGFDTIQKMVLLR